ncbi:hypothetical protein C8T65DRAFT_589292 [Cerioporus squamosus]|nr:hypothetical protein C8T65DRAFT_589292 [Cerioporus squamosus]
MAAPLPTSLSGAQPDPDLWFDDGNVIVVAQQTAFRFHRSVLSRHSETFRGMFTIPQPTSSTSVQIMDGCPVIDVTDTSYDFRHLLRAVYDGASVFLGAGPMEFGVLAAIVRMGHKYQVDPILEEALRRLNTVFSSDLSTWDKHIEGATAVKLRPEYAVEAVNLFVLTGRTDMLATAFYMCGLVDIDDLVSGVTRADGTLERLSTHDLQRCLTGRMVLLKHDAQFLAELFSVDAPDDCTCPSEEVRKTALEVGYADIVSQLPDVLDELPVHRHSYTDVIDDMHAGLCTACVNAMKAYHNDLRQDLWGRLPGFFRLLE